MSASTPAPAPAARVRRRRPARGRPHEPAGHAPAPSRPRPSPRSCSSRPTRPHLAAAAQPGALAIDEANKVSNLAIVTTVSFVFTLFAQPIVGALSDRTRSRLGRRAPWMILGAAVAAVFLSASARSRRSSGSPSSGSIIQVALNALQGPLTAIMPDRFPRERRGVASRDGRHRHQVGGAARRHRGEHARREPRPRLLRVRHRPCSWSRSLFVLAEPRLLVEGRLDRAVELEGVPLGLLDRPAPAPRLRVGVRRALPLHPRLLRGRRVPALHPHGLHRASRSPRRMPRWSCSALAGMVTDPRGHHRRRLVERPGRPPQGLHLRGHPRFMVVGLAVPAGHADLSRACSSWRSSTASASASTWPATPRS